MEIHDLTRQRYSPRSLVGNPWIPRQCLRGMTMGMMALVLAVPLFAAVPDGYVVKADSATVYLDWGKTSEVKAGDTFQVYREKGELKHPVTGEVLGHAEEAVGSGLIGHVEDKFSVGSLIEGKGAAAAGDRTRLTDTHAVIPSTPVAAAATAAQGPKELWRSEPMPHEAIGLALGDIDGDGKKEVVIAFHDQVEAFRWNGQVLQSMGQFKGHGYSNYLSIETADPDGSGHDKIFATLFIEGVKRFRTVVLEYAKGSLQEVGHVGGVVRAVEHADGRRELLLQDLSMSRELRVLPPAPLSKSGKGYSEGRPVKFVRSLNDDQLFGFAWGDWDGDGAEDLALLQGGERLRLFLKDAKWSSDDRYGGTKADFGWDNDQVGSVYPRLIPLKPASGKMQLLVPQNIQFTPIRLARLKIFKDSEILDLAWNGLEMTPQWKLPISGELADFGVGDVLQRSSPQLWMAVVGAGDKTVLIAYQLP